MNKTIYVGGTFDFFHEGHVELLHDAIKIVGEEGVVVVAVNSDQFVGQYKKITTNMTEQERKDIVQDFLQHQLNLGRICDYNVFIVDNYEQKKVLDQLRPDFVLHGTDWFGPSLAANFGVDYQWFSDRNILFVYTDRRTGMSSTKMRENGTL